MKNRHKEMTATETHSAHLIYLPSGAILQKHSVGADRLAKQVKVKLGEPGN